MLWLYDEAIADDLRQSFNEAVASPVVKVVDPDVSIPISAQLKDDKITFPIIALQRDTDYQIDTNLTNFTAMHRGVATVFDKETNNIYHEKSIPISLNYGLSILSTNTVDVDELVKEIIFKYTSMFFLTIRLPYEGNRKLRFGIEYDRSASITRTSGFDTMLSQGKLYETQIPLATRGCRLISYDPVHLKTFEYEVTPLTTNQFNKL